MATISELKRKIKALQKKQDELLKQECVLQDEVRELERGKWVDKVRKYIHTGDILMINDGVVDYHCDAIKIYEILSVSEHTNKCKHNGVPSTYTSFNVRVREFAIHAYDGDRIGRVETKQCCDIDTLLTGKKISTEDFEEFKTTVFLNPDSYDTSEWNPKKSSGQE